MTSLFIYWNNKKNEEGEGEGLGKMWERKHSITAGRYVNYHGFLRKGSGHIYKN